MGNIDSKGSFFGNPQLMPPGYLFSSHPSFHSLIPHDKSQEQLMVHGKGIFPTLFG
jgi:hypothetical protein